MSITIYNCLNEFCSLFIKYLNFNKEIINEFSANVPPTKPVLPLIGTIGMLNFLESEDELAFVLAHEIGHIELDHGLNAVIQKTSGDLFKKGAGGMGVSDSFFGGMIDFAENGYSKDLEMEADGRGAILAVRAGYDVNAALNVIKKFEKN